MKSKEKFLSGLRSFLSKPIVFFCTLYVMALTCSMSGMEMFSWATIIFFLLYWAVDRSLSSHSLEIHRVGVEFPVLAFLIIVALGLRINAPSADFWWYFGSTRNILFVFLFAWILQVCRCLNRFFMIMMIFGTVIAVYGIWQHFSGVDIYRHSDRALKIAPWGHDHVYSTVGFFSHHLTYGHSYMMILCLPWAIILLCRRLKWWQMSLAVLSFGLIFTSLVFTYGRGVWIAMGVGLLVMAFYGGRKPFILSLLAIVIGCGAIFKLNPMVHERALSVFSDNYESNEDRRKLWHINMQMFKDYPWIGIGYDQNEERAKEYFDKMGMSGSFIGHAHSNYIQILSTTGILGFSCYMLFILTFVLMTSRLYAMIPSTHTWHKVFALAALGAQMSFHVGGLTQWSFGDAEVQHQFLFWLAVVGYMTHRYYTHIVPDDHSL